MPEHLRERLIALGNAAVADGNLNEACGLFEAADAFDELLSLKNHALELGNLKVALRAAGASGVIIPPEDLSKLGDTLIDRCDRIADSAREAKEQRQVWNRGVLRFTLSAIGVLILSGALVDDPVFRLAVTIVDILLVFISVLVLVRPGSTLRELKEASRRAAERKDLLETAGKAYALANDHDGLLDLSDYLREAGDHAEADKVFTVALTCSPNV